MEKKNLCPFISHSDPCHGRLRVIVAYAHMQSSILLRLLASVSSVPSHLCRSQLLPALYEKQDDRLFGMHALYLRLGEIESLLMLLMFTDLLWEKS